MRDELKREFTKEFRGAWSQADIYIYKQTRKYFTRRVSAVTVAPIHPQRSGWLQDTNLEPRHEKQNQVDLLFLYS